MNTLRLQLLCFILGMSALLVAAVRLAAVVPALWGPLVLLVFFVTLLVALGVLATVPSAAAWERWGKYVDWRRGRYYASLARAARLREHVVDQLAQADHELSEIGMVVAERDRTIRELTEQLNQAWPAVKELHKIRAAVGRRRTDRPPRRIAYRGKAS